MIQRPRSSRPLRVATHAAELAWLAPFVAMQRLAWLGLSAPDPSAGDRREMVRMGAEKVTAFSQSWFAMSQGMWQAQCAWLRYAWTPLGAMRPVTLRRTGQHLQAAALDVTDRGIVPVRRKVVANARRLTRRPR